jgi:transposase
METHYFIGVDMAKNSFQTALSTDGQTMYEVEVRNHPSAIKKYFQELRKKFAVSGGQIIVCLEHTGIYSYPLLDYLVKNNIRVCVEPALQIKKSQGMTRGKSDKIDARRIVQYAFKNRQELRFWEPQRPVIQRIKALLVLRDRLVKIKTQFKVPLTEASEFLDKDIQKMTAKVSATMKAAEKDIAKVESMLQDLVRQDQHLQQQVKWATSVPGIGLITALNMIVSSGEFERISEVKKFACYVGVAPFEHTSGTSIRGKTRVSKMANMNLKRLLHLAAMSAVRTSDELRIFYERKVAEGKNKMSVLNAVRNKLIARVYACVRNQQMYQKRYQHELA